jgi:hypothetical protein
VARGRRKAREALFHRCTLVAPSLHKKVENLVLRRQALRDEHGLPSELADIARRSGVLKWEWKD